MKKARKSPRQIARAKRMFVIGATNIREAAGMQRHLFNAKQVKTFMDHEKRVIKGDTQRQFIKNTGQKVKPAPETPPKDNSKGPSSKDDGALHKKEAARKPAEAKIDENSAAYKNSVKWGLKVLKYTNDYRKSKGA